MRKPATAAAIGNRGSVAGTLATSIFTAGVFPGLGVVTVWTSVSDGLHVGLTVWTTAWLLLPWAAWLAIREHWVEGELVTSRAGLRTWHRRLDDIVAFRPAPWLLPAVVIDFADGSKLCCLVVDQRHPFVRSALAGALRARDELPAGRWLLKRRIVWLPLALVAESV